MTARETAANIVGDFREHNSSRALAVEIEAAIKAAVLLERGECARLCDELAARGDGGNDKNEDLRAGATACAEAIRARPESC